MFEFKLNQDKYHTIKVLYLSIPIILYSLVTLHYHIKLLVTNFTCGTALSDFWLQTSLLKYKQKQPT